LRTSRSDDIPEKNDNQQHHNPISRMNNMRLETIKANTLIFTGSFKRENSGHKFAHIGAGYSKIPGTKPKMIIDANQTHLSDRSCDQDPKEKNRE
jgi:hypothetical protein